LLIITGDALHASIWWAIGRRVQET